jgi:putative ubiquitin-RnfH superfamily antitoxin RatB of RatAB toxin-antitoxin module
MDIEVEVVFALPGREDAVTLRVPEGASLLDAVRASGMLERHPELRRGTLTLGVFGKARSQDSNARPGDRIEVYRELAIDPKEARRLRAKKKRV